MRGAPPPLVVIMGVSGSGKSTLASALSGQLGWAWLEADDCHPATNRQRMASGLPLDDGMREPWVVEVCRRIAACPDPLLLSFSGLRRAHRQRIRGARTDVLFMHLEVPVIMLERRLHQRTGHFMPPDLLDSQLAALEPIEAEADVIMIDGAASSDALLAQARQALLAWPAAKGWLA